MIRSFVFFLQVFGIGVILFHEKSFVVYIEIKVVKLKVGHKLAKKKSLLLCPK